jgi:peroxiredoxin
LKRLLWPALVLPWTLVGGLIWVLYKMFRKYGERLLEAEHLQSRIQELQEQVDVQLRPAMPSLAVGSPAPPFELPDLAGRVRSLTDYRSRALMVVFFDPGCGFCEQMAPRLREVSDDGPHLVLISRGARSVHEHWAEEHRWRCDVLFDDAGAVAGSYLAHGTPMGYLIDENAQIASPLAAGADALIALGRSAARPHGLTPESLRRDQAAAAERARAAGLGVRDIAESRLARDGLKPGAIAPSFALPDLSGRTRSLEEFLGGSPTLLVFSDVNCGPCEALAPELVRLYNSGAGLIMVSRGDADANRRKAEEHGFGFPVLLQKAWEVSRQYAMFATPIAYLIDRDGIIAEDVAVGGDAILRLAWSPNCLPQR